jgi:hypothetical protein
LANIADTLFEIQEQFFFGDDAFPVHDQADQLLSG